MIARRWRLALLGAAALLLLAGGLLVAVVAGINALFQSEPLPPLLAGLPASNLAEQRAVSAGLLDARARERLPRGSREDEALALMRSQGFREAGADAEGVRWFGFRRENFPCEESYRIGWSADASGRVGAVRTRFHSTCLEP